MFLVCSIVEYPKSKNMDSYQNKEKNLSDCIIIEVEAKEGENISFNICATKYTVDWGDNTHNKQSFNKHTYQISKNATIIITGANFTAFHIPESGCIVKGLKIKSPTLEKLDCSNLNLKNLDITQCPNLITLFCYKNKLRCLPLTFQKELTYLDCKNNKLHDLNLSSCPGILTVICNNNNLQTINIKNCPEIVYINLFNNKLKKESLNSIFQELPFDEGKIKQINIGFNPGSEKCNWEILKQKNWSLDVSLSVPQV